MDHLNLRTAQEQLNKGNNDKAEELLLEIHDSNNVGPMVQLNACNKLFELYIFTDHVEKAKHIRNKFKRMDSGLYYNIDSIYNHMDAVIARKDGEFDKAITFFEKSANDAVCNAGVEYYYGETYLLIDCMIQQANLLDNYQQKNEILEKARQKLTSLKHNINDSGIFYSKEPCIIHLELVVLHLLEEYQNIVARKQEIDLLIKVHGEIEPLDKSLKLIQHSYAKIYQLKKDAAVPK